MKAVLLFLFLFTTNGIASAIDIPANLNWNKKQAGDIVVGTLRAPPRTVNLANLVSPDELNTRSLHKRVMALKAEIPLTTRGSREVQLYAGISPGVVLVIANDSVGSGSLLGRDGRILTNWHVVGQATDVAVVFKPAVEGQQVLNRDVRRAKVLRVDQVSDLALLQVSTVPASAKPIELGSMADVQVGSDVHAIGHPTGESWTYTKGIVSQVRKGYEWVTESGLKHRADVIQTQTPINPGNSGGPLLGENGRLVGVNSFKAQGEALNFAVSVDDVRRFLSTTGNRTADIARPNSQTAKPAAGCKAKELQRGRNRENNADVILFDITCDNVVDAILETPDDPTKPVTLSVDSKDNGKIDIIYFDTDRDGKWDLSLHDTDGDGKYDLIGFHPDGQIKPSRFEPYIAKR